MKDSGSNGPLSARNSLSDQLVALSVPVIFPASLSVQPSDHPQARLIDAYAFPGFRPLSRVGSLPNDPQARVVTLRRRSKKRPAASAAISRAAGTTTNIVWYAICPVATPASIFKAVRCIHTCRVHKRSAMHRLLMDPARFEAHGA